MKRRKIRIFSIVMSALLAASASAAGTVNAASIADRLNEKKKEADVASEDAQPSISLAELAKKKEELTKIAYLTDTPTSSEPVVSDNTIDKSISDKIKESITLIAQNQPDTLSTSIESEIETSRSEISSLNIQVHNTQSILADLISSSNYIAGEKIVEEDVASEDAQPSISLAELAKKKEELTKISYLTDTPTSSEHVVSDNTIDTLGGDTSSQSIFEKMRATTSEVKQLNEISTSTLTSFGEDTPSQSISEKMRSNILEVKQTNEISTSTVTSLGGKSTSQSILEKMRATTSEVKQTNEISTSTLTPLGGETSLQSISEKMRNKLEAILTHLE